MRPHFWERGRARSTSRGDRSRAASANPRDGLRLVLGGHSRAPRSSHGWSRARAVALAAILLGVGLAASLPAVAAQAVPIGEGNENTRGRALAVPAAGQPGFTRLGPEATGVFYTNQVSDAGLGRNQILEIGSGVALGDVDGDGWVDLYFCSIEGANRLYRNLGNWTFSDLTEAAGVACPGGGSTGAVLADLDGDGDLDLLVNSLRGGTRWFANNGTGKFVEMREPALQHPHGSTTLALADLDGNGWLDVYVTTYRTNTIKDSLRDLDVRVNTVNGQLVVSPAGRFLPLVLKSGGMSLFEVGEPDVVLRNVGGRGFERLSWTDGRFLDANAQPLREAPGGWGLTAAFRDLNGDGTPDIYVCNDFFQSLDEVWINDGTGRFRAPPPNAFRHTSMSSMAVDFADLNRDGYDDLLVTDMLSREHDRRQRQRGSQIHLRMALPVSDPTYRPEYPRNTLFLSRGDGTYAEVAAFSGLEATEWTWSVAFVDVDLDGYEDVLITTGNLRDANDADLSRGAPGRFESRFVGNLRFPRLITPDLAYRNQRDLTFRECGAAWGFDTVGVSQAMALADLDNDGDLDVVVPTIDQPAGLYRNNAIAPRLAIRVRGAPPNTQGIGARIVVRNGAVPFQSQEVMCGGRYLSGDDPLRVFAAGSLTNRMQLEVTWRSGRRTVIEDARANWVYEIVESGPLSAAPRGGDEASLTRPSGTLSRPTGEGWGEGSGTLSRPTGEDWGEGSGTLSHPMGEGRGEGPGERGLIGSSTTDSLAPLQSTNPERAGSVRLPLFEDVSSRLKQPHHDLPYDELDRQPGLPRQLSGLGPGVSWYDVDANGTEDLLIGSGRGGYQVLYLNDGRGGFRAMRPKDRAATDQTTSLAWRDPQGEVFLLVGTSQYETDSLAGPAVVQQNPRTGELTSLTSHTAAVGPLALTVMNRIPLLFVGGRVRPGRYPEPASSRLLAYRQSAWHTDQTNTARLADIGLVNGALWSDLDGDAESELVLACEWGSLRVFRFEQGLLTDQTHRLGLDVQTGWWNSVATGDFDGDGRLDLVAGNWGRNTPYQRFRARPLRLYYGDWGGSGHPDLLEAYYEEQLGRYVPFRTLDRLREQAPFLAHRFATFAGYARAGITEILGPLTTTTAHVEVDWLESTVFLNRGDRFEPRPLPDEAQFAPVFGLAVGDFDGDGREDVVLAQNFFGTDSETPRYDAGRGLLLRGDGTGGFEAVSALESGLALYGEQRGCAVADFDGDGRCDLAIAQHQGSTGLFRNQGGEPGLRVRLRGPAGNRDGLGAVIRLGFGDHLGPARVVQAGSGYWSQESVIQVLGLEKSPVEIRVRWPGGAESVRPVPPGAREVTVASE